MELEVGIRAWLMGNVVSCLGVIQFVCATVAAAFWYPGGSIHHRGRPGYAFFDNFLSDLGRMYSWSGEPNTVSALLFSGSLVVLALALLPFFWFLPLHAPDRATVLRIAGFIGIASAVALIGIALTPFDAVPHAHITALFCWLATILAASGLHAAALFSSDDTPVVYPLVSFGLVLCISSYAVRGIAMGQAASVSDVVAAQKYVVMYSLVWFFVFSWRTARSGGVVLPDRGSETRAAIDAAAEEYLERTTGSSQPSRKKPRRP